MRVIPAVNVVLVVISGHYTVVNYSFLERISNTEATLIEKGKWATKWDKGMKEISVCVSLFVSVSISLTQGAEGVGQREQRSE